MFHDGVCYLLIYLYVMLRKFLLLIMWFSSTLVYVVLMKNIWEGFSEFYLVNSRTNEDRRTVLLVKF